MQEKATSESVLELDEKNITGALARRPAKEQLDAHFLEPGSTAPTQVG
jgi:hypothetical protein